MRGFLFFAALEVLIPLSAAAADNEAAGFAQAGIAEGEYAVEEKTDRLDSVVVSATRAGKNTPVTFTMVGKDDLVHANPISSLPMFLSLQPSLVAMNEGGTGIGPSKMTIRGSKGSQINVTLNGVTLNDAESQEVFWVNIPALSSILSSVQVQRGLGTSANGAGAFGASINMSTSSVGQDPHAGADIAVGSYNTFTSSISAGTGLTRSGIYFDFAYSRNYTDGYIRNAKAKVQSAFAALGWMNENNSLKLTYLMGNQHTGITWNGISLEQYETDRRYNGAGEYMDSFGNLRYYDNETDNYAQHHIQLNYTRQFQRNTVWSTTLNYTKGDGYYENYKTGESLSEYHLDPVIIDGSAYSEGDFIIREAMDNYYLVLNSDVKYRSDKLEFTGGLNLSRYDGDHIGKMLWSDVLGDGYDYDAYNGADRWYRNTGIKSEANLYARAEYNPFVWLTAYADLQYRRVSQTMKGPDDDASYLDYEGNWDFFNPRAGLTFSWSGNHKAYVSVALGHREPGRSDIKEDIKTVNANGKRELSVRPERMTDVEIGYMYTGRKITASANLYFMEYKDMLLETGRLNDVGYAIKENVPRSYRRGLELAASWNPEPWFRMDANLTLSLNKIKEHDEYISYIDNPDDWNYMDVPQAEVHYGKTDMLMSPSVSGMVRLSFTPLKNIARNSLRTTTLAIDGKYVGKQYMDNTSSEERAIPGYFVSNLSLTHEFDLGKGRLGIGGYISNLFNNLYYADGGAYRNIASSDGNIYYGVWVYPQAPINFMLKLSYRF